MSKEFMILESCSITKIETKLDEYAKAGWKVVSMSTAFGGDNNNNYTVLISRRYKS